MLESNDAQESAEKLAADWRVRADKARTVFGALPPSEKDNKQ